MRTVCGCPVVRGGRLSWLEKTDVNDLFCRRLWQHVTESLRDGDIDKATEHKRALEERQRNEERLRAETETPWCTKYFLKEVSSQAVSLLRQRHILRRPHAHMNLCPVRIKYVALDFIG